MAHVHVVYEDHGTRARVQPGAGHGVYPDVVVHELGTPRFFLHAPDQGRLDVQYLNIDVGAEQAPAVIEFFDTKRVICAVNEASAGPLATAVASKTRLISLVFDNTVQWTFDLLRVLAAAWPDCCRVTFFAREQELDMGPLPIIFMLDRVFGDVRRALGRPWGSWTKAVHMQRGAPVETRVSFMNAEFTMVRARGAAVYRIVQGATDYACVYGLMHRTNGNGWELRVRGETLERSRTLEAYGIDEETAVELILM